MLTYTVLLPCFQVVWLEKYSDELAAAEAHDAAVISKLGAAAAVAAGQINFPEKVPATALQPPQPQQQDDQQGLTVPKLSIAPLQLHGTALGSSDAAAAVGSPAAATSPVGASSPTGRGRGAHGGRGGGRGARDTKPISQYKVGGRKVLHHERSLHPCQCQNLL